MVIAVHYLHYLGHRIQVGIMTDRLETELFGYGLRLGMQLGGVQVERVELIVEDAAVILVSRTGERTPYCFTGLRIEFHGKRFLIGVGLDISKRVEVERQIRELNAGLEQRIGQRTAQLESAVKDLEGFSYSVSHDLRAPLRAIDNFSGILLEEHAAQLDAEGQRLLDVVRRNVTKMERLIDDILMFSRAGKQDLKYSRVDMAALAREVFDEIRAAEGARAIELRLATLPAADADRTAIRQVWANLLANALKFTRRRERAVIEVTGGIENGVCAYTVRDNGAGFDPQYGYRLFGVFQRLHSTEEFEGTGIGLAIVKRVLDKHGGQVWAEGEPGMGKSAWKGGSHNGWLFCHEFGHVFAARRYGVKTPDVTLWFFGGIASLERIPEKPKEELVIAIAGPLVNVVIAALLILFLGAVVDPNNLVNIQDPKIGMAAKLAGANLFLAVFNMIPAFPMDGGRVLRALLAIRLGFARATEIAASIGQAFAIALGILGIFSNPMLVIIAIFIFLAASGEAGHVQLREVSRGALVADAMITKFETLRTDATVNDAVECLIRTTQKEFPVVDGGGRLRGVLTRDAMIKALKDKGPATPVLEVMQPDVPVISARAMLETALRLLSEQAAGVIGVTDAAGKLVGLLTAENLGEMMMVRAARASTGTGPWGRAAPA